MFLKNVPLTLSCLNKPKPARLRILLCLMPDSFTHQWGTPRSQWVKKRTSCGDAHSPQNKVNVK